MKILTLVGTRPELVKLALVIAELDRHATHVLVHTGQNYDYELNEVFFRDLGIRKPDYFLSAAETSAAATIARVIEKLDDVLKSEKPHAMLLLGDTNSCLGAIATKRRQIPIFHMEAGNRCFDLRVPEEINRRIVDHISDINLVYTEHARRYLLAEGLRPETVIKTGSPMREILDHFAPQIAASKALVEFGLEARKYFLVSAHREENVDDPIRLRLLLQSLRELGTTYSVPIIFSVHPRTRTRLEAENLISSHQDIRFTKPLGFFDYVRLQLAALCVISDSGTLTEESSILGFPAITIREAHERPEGMDEASIMMSGLHPERVLDAVRITLAHATGGAELRPPADYDARYVSSKVVRIIYSYVDYINRTTWYRQNESP